MRTYLGLTILAAVALTLQVAHSQNPQAAPVQGPSSASQVAASTYEHLATAIIEIEATEDELVKSILIGYETAALAHLRAAIRDPQGRAGHLEMAAAEVANIANEGDKRIQAIRQRLAKAGHTHNTDVETKEDYLFVTNKEKKGLVAVATRIAGAGPDVSAAGLEALATELDGLFQKAIAPE